ncbi:hypothetical protein BDZ94DRAFT_1309482 [Collybia nuda]|uniref:RRM domain-containing protein n=1 Tax=Collybia nuda TaxID=64659 RepID=A0A9P5Y5D6_9AGAR|nr:hypothetical protein BDZ94DRAFT_1309482 [Collybia nuda]
MDHSGSSFDATKGGPNHAGEHGTHKKISKPDRRPKRARTLQRTTKHESVTRAKKREKAKIHVKKTITENVYSFVYVGNLESSITREMLYSTFSTCGTILRIQIRCSRGQAITTGVPVPEGVRTLRDRQYATIEFKDAKASTNALRFNGTVLEGCRIMVTVSAAELPEVQDIICARLGDIRRRQGGTSTHTRVKNIEKHDTEIFVEAKPDRHRFLGISFGMCVA